MRTESLPLVVGLPGTTIGQPELEALRRTAPSGIILFGRNVESAAQVRALVDGLGDLDPRPFVAVDLEGGTVNRLERIWGPLPSPAQAGAVGRRAVRALGEAAGAGCRALGIHLDLAPVVDLDRPAGMVGRQGRCLADRPDRVATLAEVFSDGLASWGISGCLKHFPGLGPIAADTHEVLPTRDDAEPLEPHLQVFERLAERIPVVMVAHVVVPALGDSVKPATLARSVLDRAAKLPGSPVILSDDLEMGALGGLGDLPDLVVSALRARNHGVLVCKAFDRLDEIAGRLRQAAADDSALAARLGEMAARLGTLRRDLLQRAAAIPAPDDATVAQLWEEARAAAQH